MSGRVISCLFAVALASCGQPVTFEEGCGYARPALGDVLYLKTGDPVIVDRNPYRFGDGWLIGVLLPKSGLGTKVHCTVLSPAPQPKESEEQ